MIRQGDCMLLLPELADESVDMTLTSPPYDGLREYGGCPDVGKLASILLAKTKPGGVCVWVTDDQTAGGGETGSSFRAALAFMGAGWLLNDTMIWRKKNPMPQVRQPRYSQSFEYMFVFSKGAPKTFDPIMVPCKCAGRRYDSTCKQIGGGRKQKDFLINGAKKDSNVWDIAIAQNRTGHPAAFPLELAERHISTWSAPGDLVLDPFEGSGTTAVACRMLGRRHIGFELDPGYAEMARKREEEETNLWI